MKRRGWLRRMPLALIIVLLGAAGFVALLNLKPRPEPRPEPDPPKPVVEVERVRVQDRALSVITQGSVEPRREIQLVSQVGGQITETAENFVSGGRFSKGDWLVRIDTRDYEYDLARAESNLREAERVLAEQRGQARQAAREWRDLGNEEANALFLRKPQLAAAEAAVEAARAERDQARLNLERAEIRAPFGGRIRETRADLGQYVSPGTAIADIYDDSVARVRLPLTGDQAALLDLPRPGGPESADGPKVTLSAEVAGERHQWQGQIKRTEASLDSQSRLAYAVAEVVEPFSAERHPAPLLMGSFVEAEIEGKRLENVVSLPRGAVFRRNLLYSLNEDNEVQEKQVRVLKVEGERLWVRGDLQDGEPVITGRQGYVSPGVAVRIAGEETDEPAPESGAEAPADPDPDTGSKSESEPESEG